MRKLAIGLGVSVLFLVAMLRFFGLAPEVAPTTELDDERPPVLIRRGGEK